MGLLPRSLLGTGVCTSVAFRLSGLDPWTGFLDMLGYMDGVRSWRMDSATYYIDETAIFLGLFFLNWLFSDTFSTALRMNEMQVVQEMLLPHGRGYTGCLPAWNPSSQQDVRGQVSTMKATIDFFANPPRFVLSDGVLELCEGTSDYTCVDVDTFALVVGVGR